MRTQDGGKTNSRAGKTIRSRPAPLAASTNVHPLTNRFRDTGAGNQFRSSSDQIAVGIAHTTLDSRILEVNHRLCEMLGYTAVELSSMTTRALTHPDDRTQQHHLRQELLAGTRSHYSCDRRYLRKDGSVIWVSRTVALAHDSPGGDAYLIQTIEDITERKNAEAGFLRLSRARRVMADCTHILIHAVDVTAMLSSMCQVVVESGGYKQAWVGLPTRDPARPVQLVAHTGYGKETPMTALETLNATGHYHGAAAMALASGEAHIKRDIQNDPQHQRLRSRASQLDYQCSIALPLRGDGQLVGVLVLHAAERDAFDDEEIRLLDELSDDIGFGITSLRARAAQLQAEQRSRENENRFREIFEQAAVGITRVDLDGTIVDCNQKFCDLLDYAKAELLCKTIREITHPDDRGSGERIRNLFKSGEHTTYTGEKRFMRKDGVPVWTRRTMSVAFGAEGKPQFIIGVIEDITARKEADARYRETFDIAPIGIMHTAVDSYQILHANPKICTMLGYTQDELLGMVSTDVVHPDFRFTDRPKYRKQLQKDDAAPYSSERKFVRKDGSSFWGNRTVSLARDDAGKPLYYMRLIEDITERKRAEEMVARERALLRTIIDAIPDSIYVKDRSGAFVLANKGWLEARGEPQQDIAGKTVHDYFSPEVSERMIAQDLEIVMTGIPLLNLEQKMIVKTPDGEPGPVLWAATTKVPLRIDTGEIIGTVGISRNVTEQKELLARQSMAYAVTQSLAESDTLAEAMQRVLQTIGQALNWTCGAYWLWHEKEKLLFCTETWHSGNEMVANFITDSMKRPNEAPAWNGSPPQILTGGVVRQAWFSGTPVWVADILQQTDYRRGPAATSAGLRSALGFPLLAGAQPIGVMEFYSSNVAQPDESMLKMMRAIGSQIGQFIQRKQAEDKLNFLARFDTVTGLPNRYLLTDRLGQMLVQAQRNEWSIGILFVDLDRFKLVNDTYGHAAGDQLLRQVATRMQACVRSGDTVGRLSGDEFAVVLSNLAKADDAGMVAQKIVEALAAPFDLDGQQAYVSASIGISLYPSDGGEPDVLLQNADTAMYRAKEKGRNGYQFFLPQMNERLNRRQQLESQLRGALERKEFLLQYQPKASLATGAITGFEALLRWQRGNVLVPPMDFITILEDTGLIVPVGEWVLKTVCEQIRQWTHDGITPQPVAVNLSARQFQRNDLAGMVGQALSESGIDPALLKLELTESLLMNDAKESIETLHRLKQLGIHLSVDDFGTGYSSLAYLKRFPLNELKIDRAFIRDAGTDPDDAAITLAIINLAHSLKLSVVAEGVETVEQLNFLRLHHCDEIQGYYFARPLPIDECSRMLAEDKHLD